MCLLTFIRQFDVPDKMCHNIMQLDQKKIAKKSHWVTLSGFLSSLRTSNQFADVTFVCNGDKTVRAHKVVLSACSPVLASIFRATDDNEDAIIYLDGVDFTYLENVLDFVYLGQSSVKKERETELNAVATILDIKSLQESLIQLLGENILSMSRNHTSVSSRAGELHTEDALSWLSFIDETIQETETLAKESNKSIEKKVEDPLFKENEIKYESEIKVEIPDSIEEVQNLDLKKDLADQNNGMKCPKCDKFYQTKGGLKSHFENIHKGRTWDCEKCDMKFNANVHLKIHIQTKHEGLFLQCSQCDATFGTKAAVKSHVKGKHLGMKYKCPVCPKEFVQNGALKTHLEGIHYGIRYPCKFCDYTCYDPSSLNKHMKRIHNQPLARRLEKFAKNVEKNNIKRHLFKVWNGPPISC